MSPISSSPSSAMSTMNSINSQVGYINNLAGANSARNGGTDIGNIDKKDFAGKFDNKDIQDLLDKKVAELIETSSVDLRIQRREFLMQIVNKASEKQKTSELTTSELSDLKQKIGSIVDPNSFDGKIKAAMELSIADGPESNHETTPFYLDKGKLKLSINFWKDLEMFKNLETELLKRGMNKEELIDLLNSRYNQLQGLIKESTGEVKKQIGMLYDVIAEPKKYLLVYKNELKDQSWYERELEKYGLEKEIFRVYKGGKVNEDK